MGTGVVPGLPGALAMLALAAALGVVWEYLTNLIALGTKSSELTTVAGLFVTLPALFLSSAFFPTQFQPDLGCRRSPGSTGRLLDLGRAAAHVRRMGSRPGSGVAACPRWCWCQPQWPRFETATR